MLGPDNPALHEFHSIVTSLQKLPPYTEQRPELMAERQREKEVARTRWSRLVAETPRRRRRRSSRDRGFNGEPGKPESFERCTSCSGAAVPAVVLADRLARDQLPAFLRRQHAGRPAGRAPRSIRRDPQAARIAAPRRQGRMRSGSIIRTACSIPRAISRCCRIWRPRRGASSAQNIDGRIARPLYVVAEKILSGQRAATPAVGAPRHDRLQLPQRSQRHLRRTARSAPDAPRPTPS